MKPYSLIASTIALFAIPCANILASNVVLTCISNCLLESQEFVGVYELGNNEYRADMGFSFQNGNDQKVGLEFKVEGDDPVYFSSQPVQNSGAKWITSPIPSVLEPHTTYELWFERGIMKITLNPHAPKATGPIKDGEIGQEYMKYKGTCTSDGKLSPLQNANSRFAMGKLSDSKTGLVAMDARYYWLDVEFANGNDSKWMDLTHDQVRCQNY